MYLLTPLMDYSRTCCCTNINSLRFAITFAGAIILCCCYADFSHAAFQAIDCINHTKVIWWCPTVPCFA